MNHEFKFQLKQKVLVHDYDGTIWPNCVVMERWLEEPDPSDGKSASLVEAYRVMVFDEQLNKKSQLCEFYMDKLSEIKS